MVRQLPSLGANQVCPLFYFPHWQRDFKCRAPLPSSNRHLEIWQCTGEVVSKGKRRTFLHSTEKDVSLKLVQLHLISNGQVDVSFLPWK